MLNFDKKLKVGLKKCSLHSAGAKYNLIKYNWYQCNKCKGYRKIPKNLSGEKIMKLDYIIVGLASTHPRKIIKYTFLK